MELNQKEIQLLKDMKKQEKVCVEKYNRYAKAASDQELKELFTSIGKEEAQHLSSLGKLMEEQIPDVAHGDVNAQEDSGKDQGESCHCQEEKGESKGDAYLLEDALGTEKHVAAVYNTGVFEFAQEAVRKVLNHIQTEEQEHGKKLYDYMARHGMAQGA